MDDRHQLPDPGPARALLGYLNLSDGRPAPRWQKALDEAYAALGATPWAALIDGLGVRLRELQAADPAFARPEPAAAALDLAPRVLAAYRDHHADLLAHVSDAEMFGPYFLARALEAILQLSRAEAPPSPEAVVARLNDFVGHRPVALLETRPRGEPYDHERHRPVPLYLRGAGVASGRYREVLEAALDILRQADPHLLQEAHFGFEQLDEIALDLRAYDHGHPVNRRPNYVFGEWDPHQIDGKGRYSRFVIRKVTLDALMERVEADGPGPRGERLLEGAAVLACTLLMATGVGGWGPGAIDSSGTLASLLPRIARYRDAFYEHLLSRVPPAHAERLKREREQTRQPFGQARQHLNGLLARHRALQMQQRCLALLFAEMGYPGASKAEADRIVSVSVRFLGAILGRLSSGQVECEHGRLAEAAGRLVEVEDLLRRGIACGAIADPWNVLGFQGLFPLSSSREDAVRDSRIDELVQVMEQTFSLYARLQSESAAVGRDPEALAERMGRLAAWWDRFASYEVHDVRRVHGGEAVRSARGVAAAMAAWHAAGEVTADLSFWRKRLGDFTSPRAFALVVEALLRKGDFKAALGLLGSWLGQAEQAPLEDGGHSFHSLALRWLLALTQRPGGVDVPLVETFFAHLETNADDYWDPPVLESLSAPRDEDEDDPFGAAYEGMVYRDSTAGDDGAVSDGEPADRFDLEEQSEPLEKRLRFLSTMGRLWQIAARKLRSAVQAEWLDTARRNRRRLLDLLDALHGHALPEPSGDHDSLVEYDRRRTLKEQLIHTAIAACLDSSLAVAALRGALGDPTAEPGAPPWAGELIRLEQSLFGGDVDEARRTLPGFIEKFKAEPLLMLPLAEGDTGGLPRDILRVRIAQAVLRALLTNLPRLGLLRETHDLLRTARAMEQAQPTRGRGVTELNHFFQSAYQAVIENVVRSAEAWPGEEGEDDKLVDLLERLTAPFLALWIEHSRTLQLSVLESVSTDAEWRSLTAFVQRYGGDLFHARFLTLGNLRGILHRGVASHLEYLEQNADPLRPVRLVEELGSKVRREEAVRRLETVLQAVVENYEEYKDYNTTTTQSDYGENLHVLLDFLKLKAAYDRHAWQFKPLVMAHEVLAKHGRPTTALRWQESLASFTHNWARQHLEQLARLEKQHGVRLSTVGDRLSERFVKPLALDRLCALIEPCLQEARATEAEADRLAFRRLMAELPAYTHAPAGVGLDVPAWLRKLEAEVQKAQAGRGETATLAENFFRVARRALGAEEVRTQLREWERPALPQPE